MKVRLPKVNQRFQRAIFLVIRAKYSNIRGFGSPNIPQNRSFSSGSMFFTFESSECMRMSKNMRAQARNFQLSWCKYWSINGRWASGSNCILDVRCSIASFTSVNVVLSASWGQSDLVTLKNRASISEMDIGIL